MDKVDTGEFKQFSEEPPETIEIPEININIELKFVRKDSSGDLTDTPELDAKARELLINGYKYLSNLTGDNFSNFSKTIYINYVDGKRASFLGVDLNLGKESLNQLIKTPEDKYSKYLNESIVIHELFHNITEFEEEFPMLAEMIYMHEFGQNKRIDEIGRLLENGKLSSEYVSALKNVSNWYGLEEPSAFLFKIKTMETADLKNIFKSKFTEYCSEVFDKNN